MLALAILVTWMHPMTQAEPRHILHIVYRFDVGGLERIVCNTINALDATGYRHTIVALTEVGDFIQEVGPEVEHYALGKVAGGNGPYFRRFYQLLRKLKPDVVHSYNLATIEFQWIARLAGVPVRIHAEHGRDTYDPEGKVKKYQWIRRLCAPAISKVVPVSADLYRWLVETVKLSEKKVQLIHNGVDTDCFKPAEQLEHSTEVFIFGHVARLQGIKNQTLLLESFSAACQQDADFAAKARLQIVGDGPDRAMLEGKIAVDPNLQGRVNLLGARSDVIDLYTGFDVFVMSSIAEGIPMTLLESMSMAVPHLVTRVGGIVEVIEEGKTGLAVAEGDQAQMSGAMLALFHLPQQERRQLAEQARKRIIEHFSQQVMMAAYQELYWGR